MIFVEKSNKAGRTFFIIMLVAILLIAGIAAIAIVLDGKSVDKEAKKAKAADSTASLIQGELQEILNCEIVEENKEIIINETAYVRGK